MHRKGNLPRRVAEIGIQLLVCIKFNKALVFLQLDAFSGWAAFG